MSAQPAQAVGSQWTSALGSGLNSSSGVDRLTLRARPRDGRFPPFPLCGWDDAGLKALARKKAFAINSPYELPNTNCLRLCPPDNSLVSISRLFCPQLVFPLQEFSYALPDVRRRDGSR
jgi:hypothetical protein